MKADSLTIDRGSVELIGTSGRDRAIVAGVTAMSHALGISVVGEGVEAVH
jgi:EAL domain-containing protein (putative c-di-GMP-specific phosphodiesterase class I)